ncbi:hypothetical protein DER44DRAFT_748392 [Fusarium oxysporum]|nr:hypothetical protein DER44DRAFT_748392 [Fusarium oxysporum]
MSSAGQKQQIYKSLTSDDEVSPIDWGDMLTQMDSNAPETISPLDLSKQDLPKTPQVRAPIARTAYSLQSHESETHVTYRNNDCDRGSLPKRPLDAHSNLSSSKWRKLIVPTSKFEEGVDGSFQQGLTPDFAKQHGSRASYLISNDCNQGGNGGGLGHGDNAPSSSLDYEKHVSEERSNKLAPSLLPLTEENEPHVVIAREFLVKIWDWGPELTIEVKKRDCV